MASNVTFPEETKSKKSDIYDGISGPMPMCVRQHGGHYENNMGCWSNHLNLIICNC